MTKQRIETSTRFDSMKWIAVAGLFAAALAANYHYQAVPLPYRVIAWIVTFGAMLGIAAMTEKGKLAVNFTKEARTELRKVVWPTRPETVQTTLMVLVVIIIVGLFLWAIDSILLYLIGWLTGQRG